MLESCQVLVTGTVHFVLLKRSSAHYCCLWPGEQGCHREGRLGEVWLHRAAIAASTELQRPPGETLSLLAELWCFISCSAALSDVCVSCGWCDTGTGHQSSCVALHRLQVCAASPPSDPGWEHSGAFPGSQCLQLCQLLPDRWDEAQVLLFNDLLLGILRNRR